MSASQHSSASVRWLCGALLLIRMAVGQNEHISETSRGGVARNPSPTASDGAQRRSSGAELSVATPSRVSAQQLHRGAQPRAGGDGRHSWLPLNFCPCCLLLLPAPAGPVGRIGLWSRRVHAPQWREERPEPAQPAEVVGRQGDGLSHIGHPAQACATPISRRALWRRPRFATARVEVSPVISTAQTLRLAK